MTQLAVIQSENTGIRSVADIRTQVNLVQQVMHAVMKKNVHYGVIPFTEKPTLYKAGAEVLCATFRIAPKYHIENLSSIDCYRYRVTCTGVHQTSGIVMAEGVGSASSNEEKYKWRKAVCDEEFDDTPADRRRVKYGKAKQGQGGPGFYTTKQIRTEPDDIDNTVLKMAAKRAQVAMTLNATAASDIFAQDIEDLPAEYVDQETGEMSKRKPPAAPQRRSAQSDAPPIDATASDEGADKTPASAGQIKLIRSKQEAGTITDKELYEHFKVESLDGITVAQGNAMLAWLRNPAT